MWDVHIHSGVVTAEPQGVSRRTLVIITNVWLSDFSPSSKLPVTLAGAIAQLLLGEWGGGKAGWWGV